jgi:phosphoribosylformylglycinamidine (FGAM) synthase-like enzyme
LFEAAMGSGLGAQVDLSAFPADRKYGALFSEAVGALLLEVDADADLMDLFGGLPWIEIGHVAESPELIIRDGSDELFRSPIDDLVKIWEKPFAEVVG